MESKAHKNSLPQQSLFWQEEKKELLRGECDKHHFVWDMVEFEKDRLRLKHPKIILKPLPLKGSLDILNNIKKEYFDRLFHRPFKLYYLNGIFQQSLSTDWEKIIGLIEPALEYVQFKFPTSAAKHKIGRFVNLSPKQIFDLYEPKFSKNIYLKHLATKQHTSFSIIPILEFHNNQKEESFIFRLKTNRNRILIVWENSKEGRATHLFIADNDNLEHLLNLIESFIIDSTSLKRTMFHIKNSNSKFIRKELMYIESINHDSIEAYRIALQFIIDRY